MQTFFFLTTSLNFGNIFSSESISPEVFYAKRGFGFPYFEDNIFPDIKHHLVLFKNFPDVKLPKSDDKEQYKMVFELELDETQFQETEEEGVYLCSNTIYLSLQNLKKLHFFSENEMLNVIARSDAGKNLKTLSKYRYLFDHESDLKNKAVSYKIDFAPKEKPVFDLQIRRDRLFNNFKGFIYCLLCGKVTKNSEEIAYIKSLQEIINKFALLKNAIAHKSVAYRTSPYQSSKNYTNKPSNELKLLLNDLNQSISDSEKLFISHIGTLEKPDLRSFLAKNFDKIDYDQYIQLQESLGHNRTSTEGALIKAYFKNDPYVLYETIKTSIFAYKESHNVDIQSDHDSAVLSAKINLEKYTEQKYLERVKNAETINLPYFDLEFDQNEPKLIIKDADMNDNFEKIINILLQNAKPNNDSVTNNQLLPIVEKVGVDKEKSLYKYLAGNVRTYENSTNTSSLSQNFIAFIFNANEVEQLKKYLEDKGIIDPFYAYAFYGIFSGFATLSRDFIKPITENTTLLTEVDTYLVKVLQKINATENLFCLPELSNFEKDSKSLGFENIVAQVKQYEEKIKKKRTSQKPTTLLKRKRKYKKTL